jgi:hypothetical protein
MKHLKSFNEKKDHDTLSMFKHLWDDITDDDNFDVEFQYDTTFKCYTVIIRCNKHYQNMGRGMGIGKPATEDGLTIKELGDRLLLPFVYSSELGIRIDYIHARDTAGEFYSVEECLGYTPTLDDVIMGKHTIIEFLEEWERDYIKGGDRLIELSFTFLTLAYKEDINESKVFESLDTVDEVRVGIEDIALDLKDTGLIVKVLSEVGNIQKGGIFIKINGGTRGYGGFVIANAEQLDELKVFVTRVNSYLIDNKFSPESISYDYIGDDGEYQEDARTNIRSFLIGFEEGRYTKEDKIINLRLYYTR